jgi:hypothetical protein
MLYRAGFELVTLVVIGTACIGSFKSIDHGHDGPATTLSSNRSWRFSSTQHFQGEWQLSRLWIILTLCQIYVENMTFVGVNKAGPFRGASDSSTNVTDRHEITEILLKVALNTMDRTESKGLHMVATRWSNTSAIMCSLCKRSRCFSWSFLTHYLSSFLWTV